MPLDAICLSAVKDELQVTGMKIDKVQQPERDLIVLSLRGNNQTSKLLISCGSGDARVHLTTHQFENPDKPPMFCMLLRKHLTGARILDVIQQPAERVLEFLIKSSDMIGDYSEKRLIVELIGRTSNIILTNSAGIIIDCLRKITGDGSKRGVVPGLLYQPPPKPENFFKFSPLIRRELEHRANGDETALHREQIALERRISEKNFEPYIIIDPDGSLLDFSYMPVTQYGGELRRCENFSKMLDEFYTHTAQVERMKQRSLSTEKTVKNARDRLIRKLAAQMEELKNTSGRDALRECGDIITSNFHNMEKGATELTAPDFYGQDGDMRTITLDPRKTPKQNAEKYYKAYTKAKTAEKVLTEQIEFGQSELVYLESVLHSLSHAEGERDLREIRRELVQTGFLKERKESKKVKVQESAPLRFESSAGIPIFVGRNNIQNDLLTFKIASKSDIWLHTQKIHGAHVIIADSDPDESTLYEAASLAAYYSSARASSKVAVDYTRVKNVKKTPRSRPGMVIYTDFKTIIANPSIKL